MENKDLLKGNVPEEAEVSNEALDDVSGGYLQKVESKLTDVKPLVVTSGEENSSRPFLYPRK
ncbi:MAG: hypothetical protein IKR93_06440 [Firmicutes bacterium]|nr:hypothetical protein [Bacillota bacterium]